MVFIEFMKQKEFAERLDNFNLDERLVEIDYQSRLCEKTGSHLKNLIQKLMKEKVTKNFFFFSFSVSFFCEWEGKSVSLIRVVFLFRTETPDSKKIVFLNCNFTIWE